MATRQAKEVVSYAELLAKVQGLLVGRPECRNLHIDTLDVYQARVDGANWHVTRHRRSGNDNDWPACWEAIVPDIRQLRAAFDVEAPS